MNEWMNEYPQLLPIAHVYLSASFLKISNQAAIEFVLLFVPLIRVTVNNLVRKDVVVYTT